MKEYIDRISLLNDNLNVFLNEDKREIKHHIKELIINYERLFCLAVIGSCDCRDNN